MSTFASDLPLAMEMSDVAARIALQHFDPSGIAFDSKSDGSPVTTVDKTTERALRKYIAKYRPDDAIVGEEFGASGKASRIWYLDPIDGTANYAAGQTKWGSLITLVADSRPSAPKLLSSRRTWLRKWGRT
ncbi:MAG TPA: inositol monophosphatase family protein [Candidatus Acidoferrales bacterium]|jgi:histidinol-phosphatase|nr:inositol monophosphatase family protein [Candidatus Acidoferrales bacterium]